MTATIGLARLPHAVVALFDEAGDAARAARAETRRARAWLLVEQHDVRLVVAGHGVVTQAERCVRACLQLGARIDRYAGT